MPYHNMKTGRTQAGMSRPSCQALVPSRGQMTEPVPDRRPLQAPQLAHGGAGHPGIVLWLVFLLLVQMIHPLCKILWKLHDKTRAPPYGIVPYDETRVNAAISDCQVCTSSFSRPTRDWSSPPNVPMNSNASSMERSRWYNLGSTRAEKMSATVRTRHCTGRSVTPSG